MNGFEEGFERAGRIRQGAFYRMYKQFCNPNVPQRLINVKKGFDEGP
jgi:hypothetical protein